MAGLAIVEGVEDERRELVASLQKHIRGEVRFDDGSRALYATAASNYRQVPIGVVVPRDIDDVIATLDACRRFSVPIVSRGGGTSLAGQTSNVAVVIDFSKYVDDILDLDAGERLAWVEPGVILDVLRERAEQHALTFGPDPATHRSCTLGGMIGNNSCGVHSLMAGCTASNVEELEIMTYDGMRMTVGATTDDALAAIIQEGGRKGEIHRRLLQLRDRYADDIRRGFPDIPRRVSGYNLPALLPESGFHIARALVGSEGTLVTVLRARLRLVHSPRSRVLVVLGYPSVFEAADHIGEVLEAKPIGLEGVDDVLVDAMKKKHLHPRGIEVLPEGNGWLLVELGAATADDAFEQARALVDRIGNGASAKIFDDASEAAIVWRVREAGLGATARVPGGRDTWEGFEDAAVAPAKLARYLRDFRALLDRYGHRASLYGHFGQGCVHTRIPFNLRTPDGVAAFRAFVEEAADLVVSHGGSLSGEHGDGQARAELLPKMFSPALMRAFEEMKDIWDPQNKMNPGKIVHPARLDENLRIGPDYRPPEIRTQFRYPDDDGHFARAVERCVGVGECRRLDGGVMCPSYMVTREEQHSTRGRAHLLFEVMRGGIKDGFHSDAVRAALDLCLSCKGCKSDCPVNVDVATYKAEFLSRYYARRLRPRSAYLFGLIFFWARLASIAPRVVNWLMRARFSSALMKRIAGVASERELPAFSPWTFRRYFRARARRHADAPKVLLFVDTFNNYFEPRVAVAALEVLEGAGFEVLVSPRAICCGRPLYDVGMLRLAKRKLEQVMQELEPIIAAEIPIVGLEPSCVAVFRDELVNLFPDDPRAHALQRLAVTLDELLAARIVKQPTRRLARSAVVQHHCHQHAVLDTDAHRDVLAHLVDDVDVLDAGCCGMAGGFGYEHYDVSVACAERKLAPAVRAAANDALIVADGFSCREQIRQLTGRRAMHTAEVVRMAQRRRDARMERQRRPVMSLGRRPLRRRLVSAGVAAGIVLLVTSLVRARR